MQKIGGASSNRHGKWAQGRVRVKPWVYPWVNRFIGLYKALNRSNNHFPTLLLSLTLRLSLLSLRLRPGRKLGRTAEDGGGRWRFRWIFIFSDDLMLLFQNLLYRNTRLPPLFTDLRLFSWNYDENGTDRTLNLRHLGFSNLFRSSWN
jgi:hypothetical protein